MTKSNATLVKPHISFWNTVRSYVANQDIDPNHQIYVPDNFILGNFKERKDGFVLSPGGIFYRDSAQDLQQYQKDIDEGKLEVVMHLLLPNSALNLIASKGREYTDSRRQIADQVESIDRYLV